MTRSGLEMVGLGAEICKLFAWTRFRSSVFCETIESSSMSEMPDHSECSSWLNEFMMLGMIYVIASKARKEIAMKGVSQDSAILVLETVSRVVGDCARSKSKQEENLLASVNNITLTLSWGVYRSIQD